MFRAFIMCDFRLVSVWLLSEALLRVQNDIMMASESEKCMYWSFLTSVQPLLPWLTVTGSHPICQRELSLLHLALTLLY